MCRLSYIGAGEYKGQRWLRHLGKPNVGFFVASSLPTDCCGARIERRGPLAVGSRLLRIEILDRSKGLPGLVGAAGMLDVIRCGVLLIDRRSCLLLRVGRQVALVGLCLWAAGCRLCRHFDARLLFGRRDGERTSKRVR